jgi:hypothetical protein
LEHDGAVVVVLPGRESEMVTRFRGLVKEFFEQSSQAQPACVRDGERQVGSGGFTFVH